MNSILIDQRISDFDPKYFESNKNIHRDLGLNYNYGPRIQVQALPDKPSLRIKQQKNKSQLTSLVNFPDIATSKIRENQTFINSLKQVQFESNLEGVLRKQSSSSSLSSRNYPQCQSKFTLSSNDMLQRELKKPVTISTILHIPQSTLSSISKTSTNRNTLNQLGIAQQIITSGVNSKNNSKEKNKQNLLDRQKSFEDKQSFFQSRPYLRRFGLLDKQQEGKITKLLFMKQTKNNFQQDELPEKYLTLSTFKINDQNNTTQNQTLFDISHYTYNQLNQSGNSSHNKLVQCNIQNSRNILDQPIKEASVSFNQSPKKEIEIIKDTSKNSQYYYEDHSLLRQNVDSAISS